MKFISCTLIFSFVLLSCNHFSGTVFPIAWSDTLQLPPLAGQTDNAGLAGAYCGVTGSYLIVAGGANFSEKFPWEGGKKIYHNDVYLFQRINGRWKPGGLFHLQDSLGYGASVTTDIGVICLGGENEKGISARSIILKFDSAAKKIVSSPFVPLPVPLTNLSALRAGDRIFVAGGVATDSVSNKMYALDYKATQPAWKELARLPAPVSNFVMVNLGNEIYVAGGRCAREDGISALYNSLYAYDISTGRWTEKSGLPYALSAGTGIGIKDRYILMFGGDRGEIFHRTELLIRQIGNEEDSARKSELIAEKNELQRVHPGFDNTILIYDKDGDMWKIAGSLPFPVPVTTVATRCGDEVIIPSGEVRPGVRTPHILTGMIKPK